ncbi:MAG: hypothetical protein ACR2GD_07890 [Pyrinomonadaceae bacterium]
MKKFIVSFAIIVVSFAAASAQQPRMIEKKTVKPDPAVFAPVSFKAQYEGGMFGFTRKEEGALKFDDANFRLVFTDKNNKERFSIPYKAIILIYPNQTSSQSTTGRVVERVPVPGAGIAGIFMKEKKKFMVVSFDDAEVNAKGLINFKLESQEMVDKVIQTLGEKAEMQARGDSYYRPQKQQYPNP